MKTLTVQRSTRSGRYTLRGLGYSVRSGADVTEREVTADEATELLRDPLGLELTEAEAEGVLREL